jgi:hypothetical protein
MQGTRELVAVLINSLEGFSAFFFGCKLLEPRLIWASGVCMIGHDLPTTPNSASMMGPEFRVKVKRRNPKEAEKGKKEGLLSLYHWTFAMPRRAFGGEGFHFLLTHGPRTCNRQTKLSRGMPSPSASSLIFAKACTSV